MNYSLLTKPDKSSINNKSRIDTAPNNTINYSSPFESININQNDLLNRTIKTNQLMTQKLYQNATSELRINEKNKLSTK